MNHWNSQNWVSVPAESSTSDAVQSLADAGVVSAKPICHRKAKTGQTKNVTAPIGTIQTVQQTENLPVFANTAYDAQKFLQQFTEPTFIYHARTWWKYDSGSGWKQTSPADMEFAVAPFLRAQRVKLTQRSAADVVFALNSFCNTDVPDMFDQTYFLDQRPDSLVVQHAPGWIATQSNLIHVPTVSRALYRSEPIPESAIQPLNSNLFTSGRVPCNFNPDAQCPRWEQFIKESCPDDAMMLQQMFGLSLTYDRSYNVFFVVYGQSGTGKSTCLNVLQKLSEGTVSQVSLGRFGERFFIYPLSQARLNVVHDMDSIYEGDGSVSLREAVLKSVCAGEPMEVERKHRAAHPERLRALCVFGTNNLPRFADKSEAIAQRMRIIQFPNVFRGKDTQVRSLHEVLFGELEGILLWSLRGYGGLLDSGCNVLDESVSSQSLKADTIKDSRPEILFCDECLERDDFNTLSTMTLYREYATYCHLRGLYPAGLPRVIPAIVEYMGVEKPKQIRNFGRKYRAVKGIRIMLGNSSDEEHDEMP